MANDCSSAPPRIAILLCTLNGGRFLAEQLDSIVAQTLSSWKLWVADDGSSDDTLVILERSRSELGEERLVLCDGPRRGFAANFLSLACRPEVEARYYAFCDHDDIWEPDKLARALAWLKTVPDDIPALYCGRTRLIDETGRELGFSPRFSRPPSFRNALVQNIGGGNTMVFNRAARALLQQAGPLVDVVTHDWWLYLLVTGCGGRVCYDPQPTVRYRQHRDNLVGTNIGWWAAWIRILKLFRGRFRDWNSRNIKALSSVSQLLTPENRAILADWSVCRNRSLPTRFLGFCRLGLYRQTMAGDLGLLIAVLFGRA